MCYRYTIPQELLSRFNNLAYCQATACGQIMLIRPKCAPFYPLPPALGKRAAMLFLTTGYGEAAAGDGAGGVAGRVGGA